EKTQQILDLERTLAHLVVHTPYVLLLAIPGVNIVTVADASAELGPIPFYLNANGITGRAGLMPSRYQSDQVDRANGPLPRRANRRLRTAMMQAASNLVTCNHYFNIKAEHWRVQRHDDRWIRVKVAKILSRLIVAIVGGRQLFPHPCCQQRHYILHKLLEFHREHDTPMTQTLADLDAATTQLPRSAHAAEAHPLQQ